MRLMVCRDCEKLMGENKTKGGFGPCCVCGTETSIGGPLTLEQRNRVRAIRFRDAVRSRVKEVYNLERGQDGYPDAQAALLPEMLAEFVIDCSRVDDLLKAGSR